MPPTAETFLLCGMGRDDEGKEKKIGEAGGYYFWLKIGIIIIFCLSWKRKRGVHFFF
jgi:hypothetical protein